MGAVDGEVIPLLLERLEKYGAARLCPAGQMRDADRAVLNALVLAKGRVWNVATRTQEMRPQWESYPLRVERLCRGPKWQPPRPEHVSHTLSLRSKPKRCNNHRLAVMADRTMDSVEAYEVHAHQFLRQRDGSLVGSLVVEQWSRTLPAGATVIELACGGGEPITRVLSEAGLRLWAIDSSPTLVAAFGARFPAIPVQCARVQDTDFFHRRYDAAVAIGLIFLLAEPDQAALISRVGGVIVPGGRFLFTAPTQIHEWTDVNTGAACKSLGQARYEDILGEAGFRVLSTFVDKGENNHYDAEKVR